METCYEHKVGLHHDWRGRRSNEQRIREAQTPLELEIRKRFVDDDSVSSRLMTLA